jgi:benzoate-CoA ligase family protein
MTAYNHPLMSGRFNLTHALIDARLSGGDAEKPAIETLDDMWSYARIAELTSRVGNALLAAGVQREQRVLICLPDSPEYIAAFFGAIAIGAIAVPSSTFVGAVEYRYFLRETRAPVLITTNEIFARMEIGPDDFPELRAIVLTNRVESEGRIRTFQNWIQEVPAKLAYADTHKDETAFWLWTSGSTGEPKGVVHLHQDAPWCCRLFAEGVLGMQASDRVFSAAKLFHAYGLGCAMLFPFWVGATTILLPDRARPENVYATIRRKQPTMFFGVPTLYASMLKCADAVACSDLSSLRFCVSAGEPLSADLYHAWNARFGKEILDGLGSTELLNMYIASPPGRVKPGSSGVVVPGYEVKIVDGAGQTVGTNEIGDLMVKGPSASILYWNRREETQKRMRGDWFASGDKYRVDDDGYYWYAGRADDMFKVSGEWLAPYEVEAALMAHDAVLECAVVPSTDVNGIVTARAFVVLRDGTNSGEETAAELQAFARTRLAHYKCPRQISFLAELPKTATGKIQRFKLRSPN